MGTALTPCRVSPCHTFYTALYRYQDTGVQKRKADLTILLSSVNEESKSKIVHLLSQYRVRGTLGHVEVCCEEGTTFTTF